MKDKLTVGLLLLISAVLLRCSESPTTSDTLPDRITPTREISDISETVSIDYNHAVFIQAENLLIIFQDVSEGRCPVGAYCFWEGQAMAEFLLIKPHRERGIANPIVRPSVNPDSDEFEELADDALGYRLYLLELDPYPHIDRTADPCDYTAKLRIEKLPDY